MAIQSKRNFLGAMRIDTNMLRAIESGVAYDFATLVNSVLTSGDSNTQTYVVRGFAHTGTTRSAFTVSLANSVFLSQNSARSMFVFPSDTADVVPFLNASSGTYYWGFKVAETDTVIQPFAFKDPITNAEYVKTVPTAKELAYTEPYYDTQGTRTDVTFIYKVTVLGNTVTVNGLADIATNKTEYFLSLGGTSYESFTEWANAVAASASDKTVGGDLSGTYPDATVVGIQGRPIADTDPSVGEVLGWGGTSWGPTTNSASPTGNAGGVLGYPGSTYPDPSGLAAIANTIPIASSGAGTTITMVVDATTSGAGAALAIVAAQGSTSGGAVGLTAGRGLAGVGGAAGVTAGRGSTTGGAASVTGGQGATGGATSVVGGTGTSSLGGAANVTGGNGVGGGSATMRGGDGSAGGGGPASVSGGSGPSGGGNARLVGGQSSSGSGGTASVEGGATTGSTGGNATIDSGTGTSTNGTVSVGTVNAESVSIGRTTKTTYLNGITNLSALTASLPLKLDSSRNIVSAAIALNGSEVTNTLPAPNGGTGYSSYTIGDILYADTISTLAKLPIGTSGYYLKANGAGNAPSWARFCYLEATYSETTTITNTAATIQNWVQQENAGMQVVDGGGINNFLDTDSTDDYLVTITGRMGIASPMGSPSFVGFKVYESGTATPMSTFFAGPQSSTFSNGDRYMVSHSFITRISNSKPLYVTAETNVGSFVPNWVAENGNSPIVITISKIS